MRVVLICSAAVDKRRIKIRRKKNKQDAWLPEDIEVRGVIFRMMKDAINQPCQYPVDLESETSASQPGGFEADEPEQQSEKEMESSSCKVHGALW